MTSKLGGRPSKDQPISDNFNPTKLGPHVSKATLQKAARQAKIAQIAIQQQGFKAAKTLLDVEAGIAKIKKTTGLDKFEERMQESDAAPAPVPATQDAPPAAESDKNAKIEESEAHKMLQDLRYAYKNSVGPTGLKGRRRLVELLQNDSEFKFAMKELMRVDTAIITAKLRKGEDESGKMVGQQNFFVVLKGLEDGPKQIAGVVDKTVDMKQIERALNPDENSYTYEPEEAGKNDAPEMLLGRADNSEGEADNKQESVEEW